MTKHADTRRARIRARLEDARSDRTCLRIATTTGDDVVGFVVGVGRRWAALAVAAPWPDGLTVVRLAGMERLHAVEPASVERHAFEREDAWPPATPQRLDLDRTDVMLVELAARYPVLGLQLRDSDDDLFVGAPALVAEGTLLLHELGPDATWDALSTWRLRDLSRVSVGGRYLTLLADLAPARPEQPSPFAD
ncbi:hypothetical protein [Arsenicicoccus sp. oral taxon 190]|uniref:hypothetical protein n=1 Tax=Arsenicicoccus sp. oral taxon 190 TaxID=1658671 RepID=UPI0012E1413D|nr:hypothetical protein [Arsenicicoccus sp. oral taxon 190]